MKPRFLLAVLLFAGMKVSAQNATSFGIRAGIISSGIRGDASNSLNQLIDKTNGMLTTSDKTGFFAGAYVDVPVSGNISIEPGLYYSQKGYNLTGNFGIKGLGILNPEAKASLQNQYVDFPLLIKGNFSGFEIFGGPQISYLASSDLKTTAGILGVNMLNKTLDATGQFNRWDAGLTGGAGYQFGNGINITVSYDYGLSKLDGGQNFAAYNRGIRLGVGVQF